MSVFSRLSTPDRVVGGGAIVALLSSYLTWYSYDAASMTYSIDGFRGSAISLVFVIASAMALVLLASKLRWISLARGLDIEGLTRLATRVAFGAVVVQTLISLDQGQSLHKGLAVAFLASVAMLLGSRRRAHKFVDAI